MQEYEQEDAGISLPYSSDGSFDKRSSNRLVLSYFPLQEILWASSEHSGQSRSMCKGVNFNLQRANWRLNF